MLFEEILYGSWLTKTKVILSLLEHWVTNCLGHDWKKSKQICKTARKQGVPLTMTDGDWVCQQASLCTICHHLSWQTTSCPVQDHCTHQHHCYVAHSQEINYHRSMLKTTVYQLPDLNRYTSIIKKVKASHTRYRALGPKLIPMYRQSARKWL